MLKLDLSKLSSFIPQDYLAARQGRLEKAADMLANHNGPGGDFTGWVTLPRDYDKEEFARIKAAAKKIQQQSSLLSSVFQPTPVKNADAGQRYKQV